MANIAPALNGRTVPPHELQERVRRLVSRETASGAAKIIGLSVHGVLAVAAGNACNPGTIALADARCPR